MTRKTDNLNDLNLESDFYKIIIFKPLVNVPDVKLLISVGGDLTIMANHK
jgi:hypothetical protein